MSVLAMASLTAEPAARRAPRRPAGQRGPGALAGLDLAGERRHAAVGADVHPGVVRRAPAAVGVAGPGHHGDQALGHRRRERVRLLARPGPRAARPGPASIRRCRAAAAQPGRRRGRRHRRELLRLLHELGGAVHGAPDPRVGAAPAHVPGKLGRDPLRRPGAGPRPAAPPCRSASPACRSRTACAPVSSQACWTGCRMPSSARPSTVVIRCPAASAAGTWQASPPGGRSARCTRRRRPRRSRAWAR